MADRTAPEKLTAQISALVRPSIKELVDFCADDAGITQGDVIRAALEAGLPPVLESRLLAWREAKAAGKPWRPETTAASAAPPKQIIHDVTELPERLTTDMAAPLAVAEQIRDAGVEFVEPAADPRAALRGY